MPPLPPLEWSDLQRQRHTVALTGDLAIERIRLAGRHGDGFIIGNHWLARICHYVELTFQAVHEDLQMEFTHAAQNLLPRLAIHPHLTRWVFRGQLPQCCREFILFSRALRLNGHEHHRLRRRNAHQSHWLILCAQRIARGDLLQANHRPNIPRLEKLQLLLLIGLHAQNLHHPLALPRPRIIDILPTLQGPAIDAHEKEPPHISIRSNFEDQRRKRRRSRHLHLRRLIGLHIRAHRRLPLTRRRQIIHHPIQKRLHALVLQRGATEYRHHSLRHHSPPKGCLHGLNRLLGCLQIGLHKGIIHLGQRLQKRLMPGLRHINQLRRHRHILKGLPLGIQIVAILQRDQIDFPGVALGRAHRHHHRHRIRPQLLAHLSHGPRKVRPHSVHLINKGNARDVVAIGLPPNCLRLRLHPAHRAENPHRAIQHTQRALHLDGEVHMPGRINEIDLGVAPSASNRGGSNGNPALAFLNHPVRHRIAIVHIPKTMRHPSVKEDALGRRRLARINMGDDANVPNLLHACGHAILFCTLQTDR